MYKYAIDQKPNPYIKNSSKTYTAMGYNALIPKTIVYIITSNDTGSTFGRDDIANFNMNIINPKNPYKQSSLVFIFIVFFQPIYNIIIIVMWY